MDVHPLADAIDADLRTRGTPARALHEKAYLKSQLEHYGTSVPAVRAVAKEFSSQHPSLRHDDLIALVDVLWARGVHECRMVTVELLDIHVELLGPSDAIVIERFLRSAFTWALVDGLSASVMGKLVERSAELGAVLDRWAVDDDFWLRRSALLALLVPLRRGAGDFDRFSRYADAMLEEREFFIRKAIGWVLRDTARKRPELVYEWLLQSVGDQTCNDATSSEPTQSSRAGRASGVTIREAVKPLSEAQRVAVIAASSVRGG